MPTLRACGARPSEGCAIQGKMALRGKPWHNAEGGVLGGARSPRPRGKAARMPCPFISNTRVNDGPVAERRDAPVKRKPSPRACGARPSEWVCHPGQDGLTGKTRGYR